MEEELAQMEKYREENPARLTKEEFAALEQEILHPKKETISDKYLDYKFWYQGLPSRQEWFAMFLENEILPGKGLRILEVGSGRYARLSVMLSKIGHTLTCMDPEAALEEIPGIEVKKEAFHYNKVDLEGYDFVVAQEPCEATEHIIRACTSQRVPFIIALCGVPHELVSGEMPEDVYEWYGYLADIDPEHTRIFCKKLYQDRYIAMIKSVGL